MIFAKRFLNMLGMYCFQMFSTIYKVETTIKLRRIDLFIVETVMGSGFS
jgi:hypothetical protein